MAIGLYTSRVILAQLGIVDFGIYNVVGGVVVLFAFLNSSMASSTQRFLTMDLGRGDFEKLNISFNTSLQIHVLIAIVVTILTEVVGLWFMDHKMQIPPDRINAAQWVFQFAVLSMIVNFLNVPYNAIIIAYERMGAFAYISIVEVVLKLGIALSLYFSPIDKLKFFAVLTFLQPLIIRLIYGVYCHRHFDAVKLRRIFDKSIFKEMSVFAGWSMWGQFASICCIQGLNILLNVFFGPAVNAARGVAVQVQGFVSQFSMNFQTAINPQITKTYAVGDFADMHSLIYRSAKFTYFLLFAMVLPIMLGAPMLLRWWLEDVPQYTVQFIRIILWITIIDSVANPLMAAAAATGNIKLYQSTIGALLILILPVAYLVLKAGAPPVSVFIVNLIICAIAFIARLYIVQPLTQISPAIFFRKVVLKILYVTAISTTLSLLAYSLLPKNDFYTVLTMVFSGICVCISAYYLGFDTGEKTFVRSLLHKFLPHSKS